MEALKERHGEYEVCPRCHQWLWWTADNQWTTENGTAHNFRRCWSHRVPPLTEGWITMHLLVGLLTCWLFGGTLWLFAAHALISWRRSKWAG